MVVGTVTAPRQSVADQIERVVRSRTGGRIRDLRVSVRGDRVVISGETSTFYDKQLASHAALQSVDSLLVQNDLVVA
uniref:BON domain-containing protein n=1 Tax=Schlesneria paludicola TaxID=360056 RepID=A0A7C2JZT8_9PLAN